MATNVHGGHHIIPFKTNLNVLIALLVMTVVTVAVAQVDFGALNTIIAMAIASVKAALVLMYFMHLKYDDRSYPVVFFTAVFFLILMYGLSELDIITRVLETDTVR
jgi:cytochrome c oxidase subunit 4